MNYKTLTQTLECAKTSLDQAQQMYRSAANNNQLINNQSFPFRMNSSLGNLIEEEKRMQQTKQKIKNNARKQSDQKKEKVQAEPVKQVQPCAKPANLQTQLTNNQEVLRQAVILSEIIGPPVSKRRGRNRMGRM